MQDTNPDTKTFGEFGEDMQETDGIGPAGDAYANAVTIFEHAIGGNGSQDPLDHTSDCSRSDILDAACCWL